MGEENTVNQNNTQSQGVKFLLGLVVCGVFLLLVWFFLSMGESSSSDKYIYFKYSFSNNGKTYSIKACPFGDKDLVDVVVDFNLYDDTYKIVKVEQFKFGNIRPSECIIKYGTSSYYIQKIEPKSIHYTRR